MLKKKEEQRSIFGTEMSSQSGKFEAVYNNDEISLRTMLATTRINCFLEPFVAS